MQGQRLGIGSDFSATYMAVRRLADLARENPFALEGKTVGLLGDMLARNAHGRQRQAGTLYAEAANMLARLAAAEPRPKTAKQAFDALDRVLRIPGKPRMAAAGAFGGLPLQIRGPVRATDAAVGPPVALADLQRLGGCPTDAAPRRAGRTLVFDAGPHRLLAVKLLRRGEDPARPAAEAAWMRRVNREAASFPERFDVPEPLAPDGASVFPVPDAHIPDANLHPKRLAMAYTAHADYFTYPNEHAPGATPDADAFLEILHRNALLAGRLAARGVVHTALIPLFHNRVQQDRRNDGGRYDWRRLGRLDRWLHSTRHPNFCASGLRDFEHFEAMGKDAGSNTLHRRLGDMVLALALTAGSWFRFKEPKLVGFTSQGGPVDARRLFDAGLPAKALNAVHSGLFKGFAGRELPPSPPVDTTALAARMIEEMGVDRHMYEVLRVRDQEDMTAEAFRDFLLDRGFTPGRIRFMVRGAEDIRIATGPHLGAFNRGVSLPELMEFAAAVSAACVAGRFSELRPFQQSL